MPQASALRTHRIFCFFFVTSVMTATARFACGIYPPPTPPEETGAGSVRRQSASRGCARKTLQQGAHRDVRRRARAARVMGEVNDGRKRRRCAEVPEPEVGVEHDPFVIEHRRPEERCIGGDGTGQPKTKT